MAIMWRDRIKIVLSLEGSAIAEGDVETVWAVPIADNLFKIDNIPFYALGYALDDIVEGRTVEGRIFVNHLYEESGNSTIRVISFHANKVKEFRERFRKAGCESEISEIETLFSINVPRDVNYLLVKITLEAGFGENEWDYEEGCISNKHRNDLGTL